MIDAQYLKNITEKIEIELDNEALERFDLYAKRLIEWNQKINLTAITEPKEIVEKHFFDSLTFFTAGNVSRGTSLIDIGTGAGFPGVPLLIARPDLKVTLLDSLNKRLVFLQELLNELGLEAEIIHARGEEGGRTPSLRENFDLATARAVAPMNVLAEYGLPFVRLGGRFVAMKGSSVEQELEQASHAVSLLGGKIGMQKKLSLPDGSGRNIVILEKISQTPTKYPRNPGQISKKPL